LTFWVVGTSSVNLTRYATPPYAVEVAATLDFIAQYNNVDWLLAASDGRYSHRR